MLCLCLSTGNFKELKAGKTAAVKINGRTTDITLKNNSFYWIDAKQITQKRKILAIGKNDDGTVSFMCD